MTCEIFLISFFLYKSLEVSYEKELDWGFLRVLLVSGPFLNIEEEEGVDEKLENGWASMEERVNRSAQGRREGDVDRKR